MLVTARIASSAMRSGWASTSSPTCIDRRRGPERARRLPFSFACVALRLRLRLRFTGSFGFAPTAKSSRADREIVPEIGDKEVVLAARPSTVPIGP